ncbi:hypothetical protein ACFQZT_10705 [Paenibacillus sp. GCM10027628]|uniref:hypothetical protein n=1 Tax=Paenibacillus sp. GCM10027628 TaxID=3273413 RepID=UPI0036362B42
MRKKVWLVAAIAFQLCILLPGGSSADSYTQLQEPDTLRIPPVISLLAATPFYNSPNENEGEQEGWLAPQDSVKVLAGEVKWSRGKSWWKIQTWLGEKYISPDPWNVDVPAPPKLALFEETPIYASKNAKSKPSATLAPQEVQVVGAEKQWFYSNNEQDKKWLQIHTTWLGDQWVQLPAAKIGYVKPADYYVYYDGGWIMDSPEFGLNTYSPDLRYTSPPHLNRQVVHVTGEFVTPYDTNYQIATEQGPKFVSAKGVPIVKTSVPVVLKSKTALFSTPYSDISSVITMLNPQTLTSFEKFKDMELYHVHTELGDGWVQPYYSEPVDTKPAQVSIELKGETQLYRLPKDSFQINGAVLKNQTVQPSLTWNDELQRVWYQLQTKDGIVWFMFDPRTDVVHEPDGSPLVQLTYQGSNVVTVTVDGERLRYADDVGYVKGGQPYLSVSFLSYALQFVRESGPDEIAFTHKDGYSFRIHKGQSEAVTYWKGTRQEKVNLREAPTWVNDEVYLNTEDVCRLMGASIDWFKSGDRFYIFTDDYSASPSSLTATTKDPSLRAVAYIFDRKDGWYDGQPSLRPHLTLSNQSQSATAIASSSEEEKGQLSSWFAGKRYIWFRQYQSADLEAGINKLLAAVKIGSRIVWQQAYPVVHE